MENKAMDISREQLRKIVDADSYEAAIALAKEFGLGITEEQDANIKAYFEQKADKQVSDEELDNVAGGKIQWGGGQSYGYQEKWYDVEYAFNIGDEVEVNKGFWRTERGVIITRKIDHGLEDRVLNTLFGVEPGYVPMYYVRYFKNQEATWEEQINLSY